MRNILAISAHFECAENAQLNPAEALTRLGQSVWLDAISRPMLDSGTLARYIREYSVTGLTSNPAIFERAIAASAAYDAAILDKAAQGREGEAIFHELALEDLGRAAALFAPIHAASAGRDGWVSLEVSPLLADDAAATTLAARGLFAGAKLANLFIKIPGTPVGLAAIEQSIFDGVPVNATLLFSREQVMAAAEAYMRGIERRVAAGLDPGVASVASVFVSRWDVAVAQKVQPGFRNRLGIAMAMQAYKAHLDLLATPRWRSLAAAGAQPQRLLWASTGTKDPSVRDTLYVEALAAPGTINTMPEATLLAFASRGALDGVLPPDEAYAEVTLAEFAREGVDLEAMATDLQREGVASFARSWHVLLYRIALKSQLLAHHPGAAHVPVPDA
jgi:transaldolase